MRIYAMLNVNNKIEGVMKRCLNVRYIIKEWKEESDGRSALLIEGARRIGNNVKLEIM